MSHDTAGNEIHRIPLCCHRQTTSGYCPVHGPFATPISTAEAAPALLLDRCPTGGLISPKGPHKRMWEYDGAFKCLDCKAQWGALPGNPQMPPICGQPTAAREGQAAAREGAVELLSSQYRAKDIIAANLCDKLAAAGERERRLREALSECFVDIGALLLATTWELAPAVRQQLQRTHDKAEAALKEVAG